jgi:phage terminase large subunit-like protein
MVHHVGKNFAKLEGEMCSFVPGRLRQASPNRMDALVWALTSLFPNLSFSWHPV